MLRFLHIGPVFVPYLLNFGELFPKCLAISKKCPTFALANKKHRGVEQLVARQAHNLEVARSSRTPATNTQQGRRFLRPCCVWYARAIPKIPIKNYCCPLNMKSQFEPIVVQ